MNSNSNPASPDPSAIDNPDFPSPADGRSSSAQDPGPITALPFDAYGLGHLGPEERQALLVAINQEITARVGFRLADGLADADFDEFELISSDACAAQAWLQMYAPSYQESQVWEGLISRPVSLDEAFIDCASMLWVGQTRPDYRQVVEAEVALMRAELDARFRQH